MLKNVEVTEKTAVFRIVWKIPRKSRLESRIKSTKNKGEGRNEFPASKTSVLLLIRTAIIRVKLCL